MSDGEKVTRISVIVDADERKRLKAKAAEQGVTMSDIIREAIKKFLAE